MLSREMYFRIPARGVANSLVMAALLVIGGLGFGSKLAIAQTNFGEAPTLTQHVVSGELSPVQERLPLNPMVVPVVERIGQYGGTWRTALLGGGSLFWTDNTIGYENLVRWNPEWTHVIPNIAESFSANDDATVFTFFLREGMRWSDGHPFTADDIMFWYEDVFLNEELMSVRPSWLMAGDEPVLVEKVDDQTVIFSFAAPNGLFLQRLATRPGNLPTSYPRHYLAQFHIEHNPDVEQRVQQADAADWIALFESQASYLENEDLPTVHAWVITTDFGVGTRLVAERNPYYWKVDPEGNQLPYLDSVVFDYISEPEVLLLKAMSGEIDMMDRFVFTQPNKAVLVDNMDRGQYDFFENTPSQMNTMIISLNLTHNDPVKREIFQNKDFRIGLSYAIDRQEIIDLVYVGEGEPWQGAPQRLTAFFHERLAKQYTEHDIDLANEHLDRAGYSERDAQGFRLGPDGNHISFTLEVATGDRPEHVDVLELIQLYWRDVGVDMQVRPIDRSILYTRKAANEHDAVVWLGGGGLDAILDPRSFFPFSSESNYAEAWQYWYNNPSHPLAEEPPAPTRRQMELYDQIKAEADSDRQNALMHEILEIAADEFYVIGISSLADGYGVVTNHFRNVPDLVPLAGPSYPSPGPVNPSQFFIDNSAP